MFVLFNTHKTCSFKYRQTIVMDGNFVSQHLKMRNPADDVFLSDGHGFMVGSQVYEEHLKDARRRKRNLEVCHFFDGLVLHFIADPRSAFHMQ